MSGTGKTIRTGAAALTVTLSLLTAWLCPSCSGCSGHRGGESGEPSAEKPAPEAILATPVVLDEQALRSYANAVSNNADFDAADMATMIRLSEGALNRLGQETERLEVNDDPADSYNVLTELAGRQWVGDACTIIAFLRTVPLGPEMRPHTDQLVRTAARISTTLDAIAGSQLGGKRYLTLDIEPRRN